MPADLGTAYVQIVPSAKGIDKKLKDIVDPPAEEAGESGGRSLGRSIVSSMKRIVIALGIGKVIGDSMMQGGALQQSLGGVETIFKDSAGKMKKYAADAFRTAGLSANEYMEQATSFSASLLQSLKGNTSKAADYANMAMVDMSDNVNKFGSNVEDVQHAYQGFAKQNFTMLDNLKLGYGGTKEEMQRLIEDANKVKEANGEMADLSIDSFADMIEAVHIIQTELDITGTTAKEAATTLSGSFSMMKAAAKNLMGNMALGKDVEKSLMELMTTVKIFVMDNFFPMMGTLLGSIVTLFFEQSPKLFYAGMQLIGEAAVGFATGIPKFIDNATSMIRDFALEVVKNAPSMIFAIREIIRYMGEGLKEGGPILVKRIPIIISLLANSFMTNGTKLINIGVELLTNVSKGLVQGIPMVISSGLTMLQSLGDFLTANVPTWIEKGFEMLTNFVDGIINALPDMIARLPVIISTFANIINDNFPTILLKGAQLIWHLIQGILSAIPDLVNNIPAIVKAIVDVIVAFDWLNLGVNIIKFFTNGIRSMFGVAAESGKGLFKTIIDTIKNLPAKMSEFAHNAISKIINTFSGGLGTIKTATSRILHTIIDTFKGLPLKVWDCIKAIPSYLVKAFQFTIPKIPLPHFSITPEGWKIGDLLKGKIPTLDIQWYANGGFFNSGPQIAGLGEAGKEYALPLNKKSLMPLAIGIDELQNDDTAGLIEKLEAIINLLKMLIEAGVYIDGDKLVGAILPIINRKLGGVY